MKTLHRLIIRSFLGPLAFTFFIAVFIFLMQFLWKYIDDLVGKGLEWYVLAELLFYASSTFVPLALPLAILLSSIMTFGNLGEHYELVSMKSAGISLRRIMAPLIVLSIVISISAYYFSDIVLPMANLKFKSLLYDVRKQKLAFNLQEGVFYNGIENYVIRVGKKDKNGNTIYDVMVYDHSDHMGNVKISVAKKGQMELTPDQKNLVLTLHDGYNYQENFDQRDYRDRRQFQVTSFRENRKKFDLLSFTLNRTDEVLFKNNYQMMNLRQLDFSIDSLKGQLVERSDEFSGLINNRMMMINERDSLPDSSMLCVSQKFIAFDSLQKEEQARILTSAIENSRSARELAANTVNDWSSRKELIYKHEVVWHQKFTLAVACLLFFFIGAPLGAIIRKGGLGLPVVISTIFFILFHIVSITGEKYTRAGLLPAYIGMWIAPFMLLPIGLFLTRKATTDSPLLDTETWNKIYSKFTIEGWQKKPVSKNSMPKDENTAAL
ncbi:MAG: LptF/LptG family permease [Bacteroidales bacterium]|nr:LptF/LptG family permease [Bacteroidales bacterium]